MLAKLPGYEISSSYHSQSNQWLGEITTQDIPLCVLRYHVIYNQVIHIYILVIKRKSIDCDIKFVIVSLAHCTSTFMTNMASIVDCTCLYINHAGAGIPLVCSFSRLHSPLRLSFLRIQFLPVFLYIIREFVIQGIELLVKFNFSARRFFCRYPVLDRITLILPSFSVIIKSNLSIIDFATSPIVFLAYGSKNWENSSVSSLLVKSILHISL